MPPMKSPLRHRDDWFEGTLSVQQVARRWELSAKQVRELLARQVVAFVQIRGALRVPLSEVKRVEAAGGIATIGGADDAWA